MVGGGNEDDDDAVDDGVRYSRLIMARNFLHLEHEMARGKKRVGELIPSVNFNVHISGALRQRSSHRKIVRYKLHACFIVCSVDFPQTHFDYMCPQLRLLHLTSETVY
jgi:hypothetical protein